MGIKVGRIGALALLVVAGCVLTLSCGERPVLPQVGRWQISEVPVGSWQPSLYDCTLVLDDATATVEEVFGGQCRVTTEGVPYHGEEQDGGTSFRIAFAEVGAVKCSPSPCDAVLPSLTGGKATTIGRCPNGMPPSNVLPFFFKFRVKDSDHLLVDVPYWIAALPYVVFRRVETPR